MVDAAYGHYSFLPQLWPVNAKTGNLYAVSFMHVLSI